MMPKVIRLATQTPATEFIPSEAVSWWHIQSWPTLETIKHNGDHDGHREAAGSASNAILSLRNMLDLPATAKVDEIVAKVHQLMQQIPSSS